MCHQILLTFDKLDVKVIRLQLCYLILLSIIQIMLAHEVFDAIVISLDKKTSPQLGRAKTWPMHA